MGERWSAERAWAWYNGRPWLRGCNYMSRDCANRIDQWQEYGFEERLKTADEELALAAKVGSISVQSTPSNSMSPFIHPSSFMYAVIHA